MLANLAQLTTILNLDALPVAPNPPELDAADLLHVPDFAFFIQLPEHQQLLESIVVEAPSLETTPNQIPLLLPLQSFGNSVSTVPTTGEQGVAVPQLLFEIEPLPSQEIATTETPVTNNGNTTASNNSVGSDRPAVVSPVQNAASIPGDIGQSIARQAVESVQTDLVALKQHSRHSITVDINPPELGRMNIQVHVSADRISAQIVVSEWLSAELLSREKDNLIQALSGFGFGNASVDISHGSLKRDHHTDANPWDEGAEDTIEESTERIRVLSGQNLNGLNLVA